jgi:hypothetical protein
MKIVINKCHGGFGISEKAVMRYAELKGITLYPSAPDYLGTTTYWTIPQNDPRMTEILEDKAFCAASHQAREKSNELHTKFTLDTRGYDRSDPVLIQVIEELGEEANGGHAELKVVEVPDDVEWEIHEYDGVESVHEVHRTWG